MKLTIVNSGLYYLWRVIEPLTPQPLQEDMKFELDDELVRNKLSASMLAMPIEDLKSLTQFIIDFGRGES